MSTLRRIQDVYAHAKEVGYGNLSKLVIMSDIHRGDRDYDDDFAKNRNIYTAALKHYYKLGFTYIELGDGDELWKNDSFADIADSHKEVFIWLAKFYEQDRLHMIYGNHDIAKKNARWVRANLYARYDKKTRRYVPMFPDITVHEGLILRHKTTLRPIFLIHGHQGDLLNDTLWPLGRFLVRHLWRPLEALGVNDPTSASLNGRKTRHVEQDLIKWTRSENIMLIAGHTHRIMFPQAGEPPYFNDGCCVYPHRITALEIQDNHIALVIWSVETRDDSSLYVAREVLESPAPIDGFFTKN